MTWNPTQYLKFSQERFRPAMDLLLRIPLQNPQEIIDLGCGTGNGTQMLHTHWPEAHLTGIDSSQEMLNLAQQSGLKATWLLADLNELALEKPVNLLFSNAALQWLDNHDLLFPKLMTFLKPNGVLAVQIPRNFTAPSHKILFELASQEPWKKQLQSLSRPNTHSPEHYEDLLTPLADNIDIWETTYYQVLEGENPVADFVKGSTLGYFLNHLDTQDRAIFEAEYRKKVKAAYPSNAKGQTIYPFKRLFIVANR